MTVFGDIRQICIQGRFQAEITEYGRMQPVRYATHFVVGAVDLFFDIEDMIFQVCRFRRQFFFNGLKDKIDAGQCLAGFIVQFLGNALPLQFL